MRTFPSEYLPMPPQPPGLGREVTASAGDEAGGCWWVRGESWWCQTGPRRRWAETAGWARAFWNRAYGGLGRGDCVTLECCWLSSCGEGSSETRALLPWLSLTHGSAAGDATQGVLSGAA